MLMTIETVHVHSLGGSCDPKGGDLDNYTSSDSDSKDGITHVLCSSNNLK
jgi:hypothetical protein